MMIMRLGLYSSGIMNTLCCTKASCSIMFQWYYEYHVLYTKASYSSGIVNVMCCIRRHHIPSYSSGIVNVMCCIRRHHIPSYSSGIVNVMCCMMLVPFGLRLMPWHNYMYREIGIADA